MPKKFSFRLEPILNLRKFRTKQAQDELSKVLILRLKKENEILEAKSYLEKQLKKTKKAKIKAEELQNIFAHIDFSERELKKLKSELANLIEIENVKRQALSEKMKEEKILEKLKENKKIIYNEEIYHEERKFLDEIALKSKLTMNLNEN